MSAVMRLLSPLVSAGHRVVDANEAIRRNNSGFDILIDDQLRVQVKGSTTFDVVQAPLSGDPSHASMQFDVLILVDLGILAAGEREKCRKLGIVSERFVSFYVLPVAVVTTALAGPTTVRNSAGAWFMWWRHRGLAGPKDWAGSFHDLPHYRNRFDLLTAPLAHG